jgi:hypothetical protein
MMLPPDEPGTHRLFVNTMRGPLYSVSYDGKTVTGYLDVNALAWGGERPVRGPRARRAEHCFSSAHALLRQVLHVYRYRYWYRHGKHDAKTRLHDQRRIQVVLQDL